MWIKASISHAEKIDSATQVKEWCRTPVAGARGRPQCVFIVTHSSTNNFHCVGAGLSV